MNIVKITSQKKTNKNITVTFKQDYLIHSDELYFVKINNYESKRVVYVNNIYAFINMIKQDNNKYSYLELLHDNSCKLYFDIEGLNPGVKIKDIVDSIIDCLLYEFKQHNIKFIQQTKDSVIIKAGISKNEKYSHSGKSYHVVLNVLGSKSFLKWFCTKYEFLYVDNCVYSKNRLLRTLNQFRPASKTSPTDYKSKHRLHKLIEYKININTYKLLEVKTVKLDPFDYKYYELMVIQNTNNCVNEDNEIFDENTDLSKL